MCGVFRYALCVCGPTAALLFKCNKTQQNSTRLGQDTQIPVRIPRHRDARGATHNGAAVPRPAEALQADGPSCYSYCERVLECGGLGGRTPDQVRSSEKRSAGTPVDLRSVSGKNNPFTQTLILQSSNRNRSPPPG